MNSRGNMAKLFHCDKFWHSTCVLTICAGCWSFPAPALHAQQPASADKTDPLHSVHDLLGAAQYAQAEKALGTYLEKNPSSAEGHFLLGYTFFREQRPKESLAEFTEGAKYQRPQASDLKIVAADYVVLGDFADADKWLTAVVEETPKDADAWYLLGRTKYNENRFEEAIEAFQRTLTLRPGDVKAENNLGLSYQGLNRPDDARKAFENAISWQEDWPVKDPQPYLNMGILLADQDQAAQALPWLQQAVKLAPRNPKIHEELARAYDLLKMPDKAQHELEQAITLAPDIASLHYKLGQVYRRQGKQQLAQQQFDICTKLNSTHSSAETPNPAEPN